MKSQWFLEKTYSRKAESVREMLLYTEALICENELELIRIIKHQNDINLKELLGPLNNEQT